MDGTKLVQHRAKNLFHTVVLLVAMAGVLGLLGWFLAGVTGLVVAGVLGISSLWMSPRLSPRLMLRLYGAKPLPRHRAPTLYRIVEILTDRADLEHTPEVYYLPSRMMNAITVGKGADAAIGVTDGLLRGLELDEIAGVVAHEIAHLANGDTRVMSIADMISRLTSMMSSFGKLLLFINLPLILAGAVTIPWSIVLVLLLAPIATGLLQLALSRTREFDADLNAVRLTGDPGALARGLQKLEKFNESIFKQLVVPGYGRPEPSLLRTHPHPEKRIERLEDLSKKDRDRFPREDRSFDVPDRFDEVRRPPRWRPLGIWY